MQLIEYKRNAIITTNDLKALYLDAGWVQYTHDIQKLKRAYDKSDFVVTVWDDMRLVGAIRAISDDETIVFIQDILVLKAYKRKGIGSQLLQITLERYKEIRQKVLLTDDIDITNIFYEKNGFVKSGALGIVSFVMVNNDE